MAFLASMRLFSRYRSILVKLIIAFLLHQFDDVAEVAVLGTHVAPHAGA